MSFLSRWGFSRQERIALTVICGVLALGMVISTVKKRSESKKNFWLSPQEKAAVAKLAEISQNSGDITNTPAFATSNTKFDSAVFPLDINTADLEQLEILQGIGPVLAERIIEYRNLHGNFASVDSLINVKGIGKSKLNLIKDNITVNIPRREN